MTSNHSDTPYTTIVMASRLSLRRSNPILHNVVVPFINNVTTARRTIVSISRSNIVVQSNKKHNNINHHQQHNNSNNNFSTATDNKFLGRRKKTKYEKYNEAQLQNAPTASTIEDPFQYSGETLDEYVTKANLSPWTPVPDSVARKIFDNAMPSDEDVRYIRSGFKMSEST